LGGINEEKEKEKIYFEYLLRPLIFLKAQQLQIFNAAKTGMPLFT
jgi:hypothetical protein